MKGRKLKFERSTPVDRIAGSGLFCELFYFRFDLEFRGFKVKL